MVNDNESVCPSCGGELIHYDSVQRIVRTRGRDSRHIRIRRLQCSNCKRIHRELPNFIFPYKQYEKEVILGVQEGLITPDTFGYEDYPCEMTMFRWKARKTQLLL